MKHRDPLADWETELHRELEALPELVAPPTLIPSVLKRIHAPAPWHRSAWWQWPMALRAASVGLVLAVLGALGWLGGSLGELGLAHQLAQTGAGLKDALVFANDLLGRLSGSAAAFWRPHGQIVLGATAALLLATYLTCVAAGTALYRLAWRRTL
ncbi:MAG: hypothetical protein MUC91_09200 [Verrucomicrobia bacterium]|jgi:hypothetical protein|nr:hypothetical protein [Verrucomicrobiota bacterium]